LATVLSYSHCSAATMPMPNINHFFSFEPEFSISVGITIAFNVVAFLLQDYISFISQKEILGTTKISVGCGVLRDLVKLVPENVSAVRQGMLEEMLCGLLAKTLEIKPALPFLPCHRFLTPLHERG